MEQIRLNVYVWKEGVKVCIVWFITEQEHLRFQHSSFLDRPMILGQSSIVEFQFLNLPGWEKSIMAQRINNHILK